MLDAVIPLPSPDRTPPVTTTYFMQSTGFEANMSRISTLALWITKLLAKAPVSQV